MDIGYGISVVGLQRGVLYGVAEAPWNLPLSIRRQGIASQGHTFAARQVKDLVDNKELPLAHT